VHGEATNSTDGLRRGGISGGTHPGSTRIPPLHGPRGFTVSQHQQSQYKHPGFHGRHHMHSRGRILEEFLHKAPSVSLQDNTNKVEEEVEAVKEGATDTEQENHPILAPPPLNAIPEFNPTPPSLFIPEQLELIFNLRSHMADQLHRDTLISKRIDMLFDAFSNAPAKQCFPTCAQPFVLQPNDDTLPGASDDRPPGAND
jgi:hypothetical protein